jgi:hypothetical protein
MCIGNGALLSFTSQVPTTGSASRAFPQPLAAKQASAGNKSERMDLFS